MAAAYRLPGEHVYQGMVLPGEMKREYIEQVKDLITIEGDVIIVGYPKTGNHWLLEVTELISFDGDVDKAHYVAVEQKEKMLELEREGEDKSWVDVLNIFPRPCTTVTSNLNCDVLEKHILEGRVKFIVHIRNPKDTLVSLYHFYRMYVGLGNYAGSWDEFFELYTAKRLVYGDYFDWYESWLPYLHRPNVMLVKYEDMKKRTPEMIKSLTIFLGKSPNDDVIKKIEQFSAFDYMKGNKMTNFEANPLMKSEISPFHRKGTIGDWKNYFTESQSRMVDEVYDKRLKKHIELEFE